MTSIPISCQRAEERYRRLIDANPHMMYRLLVDSIPSSVVLIDENLQVVLANRNFLEKTRRGEKETLGKRLIDVFPRVIVEDLRLEREIQEVFSGISSPSPQRLTYRAPRVPLRTYYYSILPLIWDKRVELVMLLMDDMTEQLRLAEEIRRVERHLASVVECANELVVSTDVPGRIFTWNRAAERLSGFRLDEVRGRHLWDFCAAEQRPSLKEFFSAYARQSGSGVAEHDLISKTGNRVTVSWAFSPMKDDSGRTAGVVAVGRDLSERRKLEQQLVQSQKLAALGVMAGGIAHQVRTPLAISSSAAQFLMEEDITPEFRKECAEKVYVGIRRASEIIGNLLRFARPSARWDMVETDLVMVLREAIKLVEHQAAIQNTSIVTDLPPGKVLLRGNASLLEHTFLNLFLNALNAMPDGGRLTVALERSAKILCVRVADTGCGIAGEEIDKIFDPFYTTQAMGKGTGLGLSICYSVVQQHGGSIEVESAPEKGSSFRVKLPACGRNQ